MGDTRLEAYFATSVPVEKYLELADSVTDRTHDGIIQFQIKIHELLKLAPVAATLGHSRRRATAAKTGNSSGNPNLKHDPKKETSQTTVESQQQEVKYKKREDFFFVPKLPQVKVIPETKFSTCFFNISETVCCDILKDTIKAVLEKENIVKLFSQLHSGSVDQFVQDDLEAAPTSPDSICDDKLACLTEATKIVIDTALKASLSVQKETFKQYWGDKSALNEFLGNQLWPENRTRKLDKKWGSAVIRACFDFARVFPKSFVGKVSAKSDGFGLHLYGSSDSKKTKKGEKKSGGTVPTETAPATKGKTTFIGGDMGKGGFVASMHDRTFNDTLLSLAQAEAAAAAKQKDDTSSASSNTESDLVPRQAPSSVRHDRAAAEASQTTVLDHPKPQYFDEQEARQFEKASVFKAIHCISKAQRASQLQEKHMCRVREERRAIMNRCLAKGVTIQQIESERPPLHHGPDGMKQRLAVAWLLYVTYNSGAQRHQRRTRDMRKRCYDANQLRLLTRDLPMAVDDAAASGSSKSSKQRFLHFPSRSQQSRGRESQHGWKRGTHQPQPIYHNDYAAGQSPSQRHPDLRIYFDPCPVKGQKTTSSYNYAGQLRSLRNALKARPLLAQRISIQTINGYRTSKQADAVFSCLTGNYDKINHRRLKATDLKENFQGPMPSQFHHLVCPVTGKIVRRDVPASINSKIIGMYKDALAPRPRMFT